MKKYLFAAIVCLVIVAVQSCEKNDSSEEIYEIQATEGAKVKRPGGGS